MPRVARRQDPLPQIDRIGFHASYLPAQNSNYCLTRALDNNAKRSKLPVSDGYFQDAAGKAVRRTAFDYIRDHLGYRIELQRAAFPTEVKADGVLDIEVDLINRGFSTLHNPRHVYVALIGPAGDVAALRVVGTDPRRWQPHKPRDAEFKPLSHNVRMKQPLPAGLKPGAYRIGLWMPDSYRTIRTDPRYAVRVANRDVPWWTDSRGHYGINVLGEIRIRE